MTDPRISEHPMQQDGSPPPTHPLLLRLAVRLLAKAERSVADRAVRLRLDARELPEVCDAIDGESIRRVEWLLRDLERTGWARLVLSRERPFAGFADRSPQLELIDFDALAAWAGYTPRADRWQQRWMSHLEHQWAEPDVARKQALIEYLGRNPLRALADSDLESAQRSLETLRDLCASGRSMPVREASAQAFQGRSKVLDNRDELLRLLGAESGQFWEAPIQLLVDIPARIDEALFIENLVTFERMADTRRDGWRSSLLIYAAGFRAGAKRLRQSAGCRLYLRAGCADPATATRSTTSLLQPVTAWLFENAPLPVRFFGDLDFSGMQILASLREGFAQAEAWRSGYGDLILALQGGEGHQPEAAGKEGQIDPGTTGCPYADEVLLATLRRFGRFIDQESWRGCGGFTAP